MGPTSEEKGKKIVTFVFLFFFGFCLIDCPEVWTGSWQFLEKDDEGIWFYDRENVHPHPNSLIRVRTKKIYDQKGVLDAVEKYGKDYRNLDYALAIWEINCLQRKFKLISARFYSKNNTIIQAYNDEEERYFTPEDIPVGSYLELLHNQVCR
jgi:hypothetical protein